MEMEKLAKDSKLHIRVHKLDFSKTQIIGFLAQNHLEESHINLYNKWYYVHGSSRNAKTDNGWMNLSQDNNWIIAIVALENGAFCTVFSENFHKF